jgi:predicted AlkP superfamily phosphohydrolase/phosphomutase
MVIALDALDVRWLRRWIAEGRLPNLARLIEDDPGISVRSSGATLHGSIWPTFAVGAGPGHHGIYWWAQWLAEEASYVRNSHPAFRFVPFWRAAARAGRRVIVVDVPYAPALRDAGVWTANGWGLHDEMREVSYPAPFMRAIRRRYGDHPMRADTVQPVDGAGRVRLAERLRGGVAMRARLVRDFAARRDWDLFIATFSETHKAGHYLAEPGELVGGLTNDDAMAAMLEPLDTAWPEIVERAGDDCDILLLSLHGMEPQIEFAAGVGQQLLMLFAGEPPESGIGRRDLLRRMRDLLPAPVQDAVWLALPDAVRSGRVGQLAQKNRRPGEDLFLVAHDASIAVRAAVAGRERDGHVAATDVPALLDRLEKLAQSMTADDGALAFGELLRLPELFPGPRAHRLPDAVLMLNPAVRRTTSVRTPGVVMRNTMPEARNGVHTSQGFCYIRPGGPCTTLRHVVDNVDFAPTVLGRLGVGAPAQLEGETFLA